MRPKRLYLIDIRDAAEAIATFLRSSDRESFIDDDLVRSAVLHKLTVIGEAAARLPRVFRERYLDIPWADIGRVPQYRCSCVLRGRLVHRLDHRNLRRAAVARRRYCYS